MAGVATCRLNGYSVDSFALVCKAAATLEDSRMVQRSNFSARFSKNKMLVTGYAGGAFVGQGSVS